MLVTAAAAYKLKMSPLATRDANESDCDRKLAGGVRSRTSTSLAAVCWRVALGAGCERAGGNQQPQMVQNLSQAFLGVAA